MTDKLICDSGVVSNAKPQTNSLEDIVAAMNKVAMILNTKEEDKILERKAVVFKYSHPDYYKMSTQNKALIEDLVQRASYRKNEECFKKIQVGSYAS